MAPKITMAHGSAGGRRDGDSVAAAPELNGCRGMDYSAASRADARPCVSFALGSGSMGSLPSI